VITSSEWGLGHDAAAGSPATACAQTAPVGYTPQSRALDPGPAKQSMRLPSVVRESPLTSAAPALTRFFGSHESLPAVIRYSWWWLGFGRRSGAGSARCQGDDGDNTREDGGCAKGLDCTGKYGFNVAKMHLTLASGPRAKR